MLSQLQILMAIEEETKHLEDLIFRYRNAAQNDATADTNYKIAKAKALLKAKSEHTGERISVDIYEATALVACEDEFRVHLTSSAILDALGKEFRAVEARLDALRTLSASHRAAGG